MLALILTMQLVAADDWTRFRGPNGSGVATAASKLPVKFGPSQNLAWKATVPFGRSIDTTKGSVVCARPSIRIMPSVPLAIRLRNAVDNSNPVAVT